MRDEGEQALELAERVRVNAESQRAEAEGMLLIVQEKERQLAQVIRSLFFFFFFLTGKHTSHGGSACSSLFWTCGFCTMCLSMQRAHLVLLFKDPLLLTVGKQSTVIIKDVQI